MEIPQTGQANFSEKSSSCIFLGLAGILNPASFIIETISSLLPILRPFSTASAILNLSVSLLRTTSSIIVSMVCLFVLIRIKFSFILKICLSMRTFRYPLFFKSTKSSLYSPFLSLTTGASINIFILLEVSFSANAKIALVICSGV